MSKKTIVEGYDINQLPRIPKGSKWITVQELGTILKRDVKEIYEDAHDIEKYMKNPFLQTESESNEFNAKGGMSTKELIARLDAVPFGEFQNGLKEKNQNCVGTRTR